MRTDHLTAEQVTLGNLSTEARFKDRPGKRISSWLSIRHGRTNLKGITVFMTFRGQLIPLSLDEAKRLHQWLEGVIP